ncbi:MAG: DNA-binding response regulator [Firmicutes bacterium HGW-Firmicutes-2]|jgi:DNA-binding response OmpR family regulator|nr:MAG: DNA-binding response regulator [Firmicutes bacterium HGW-Firmicutes-2]
MRILIIEDEVSLAEALLHILKKNNYSVDMVHDGEAGLDYCLSQIYDVILLDIMLPKMDGLTVLKHLRKEGMHTPVLLLTARGEVSQRVEGLDSGADDYLIKPFASEELLARIRVLSRRKGEIPMDHGLTYGDLKLDPNTLKLTKDQSEVKMTLREYQLLEFLILRKGMVTSKESILEKLWGFDTDAEHNHVEVYISFLRKKLIFVGSTVSIHTLRGVGYTLEVH